MTIRIIPSNHRKIYSFILGCISLLFIMQGCYDSDNVGDNFYTFKGETIGSYLSVHDSTFSEFNKAVEIAGLSDLLRTYNKYTCFAPTNEAMANYYKESDVYSLEELSDSAVKYMVYSHIIAGSVYNSVNFVEGALSSTNMNSRYLVVGYKGAGERVDILINSNSTIIERDIDVENGIIHSINKVLSPSTAAIPTLISQDPRVSIFAEALERTALGDFMQSIKDESYLPMKNPISIDGKTICRSPKERKFGYTVFIESNEVLAKYNITDYESLKAYAASIYNVMYPEDAGISDVTDRRNSLNRFIAYHIIDKTVHYNNFFYKANMTTNALLYEFMETFCPNTIFKVSNESGGVIINHDASRNVQGVTVLPIESGYEQDTDNGVYHLIDKILTYNQSVVTMLLNTRIRVDVASLHPELMTNGIRYEKGDNPSGVTGDANYYLFSDKYLKNVQINNNNTMLYYLQGSTGWVNYQADEMMAKGQFDFTMRLPPVPAGTYEIRFGYTANVRRGIIQFYVDGEPQGIPLNMKITAENPKIGWIKDENTQDNGIENDKMMKNRGYLKGGTSYRNNTGIAREHRGALRRIITTKSWDYDGPHYIRFKSVSEDAADEFMLDYFEFVPKNVYENPNGIPEDRL